MQSVLLYQGIRGEFYEEGDVGFGHMNCMITACSC